jgi:hypothetical protein
MRLVLIALGLFALETAGATYEAPALVRLELMSGAGQVGLDYLGRRLAVYEFQPEGHKPSLLRLASLEGAVVVTEGTADRPDRRGLGLGFQVQDLSFWNEEEDSGWQRSGRDVSRRVGRDPQGRSVANVDHSVYWVPSADGLPRAEDAWLTEERRLRFVMSAAMREMAVDWESVFTVGDLPGGAAIRFPSNAGLGLQLAPEFQHVVVSYAVGETDATAGGVAANWVSLAGDLDGRPVTLTVSGGWDRNPGLSWDATSEPPAYLAVRPNPATWPRQFRSGDRFRLRFLVTIHARRMTAEALTARESAWRAEWPAAE